MKKFIFAGVLSLLIFGTNLYGQQFFSYDWKSSEQSKARFAVYPPLNDYDSRYIVKQLNAKGETGVTGFFETTVKGDLNTGKLILFSPKGDSLEMINFVEGKKNGTSLKWRDTGELYGRQNFLNGKEDGISEWYFKNGKISARYVMSQGEKISENFWYDDGTIEEDSKEANKKPQFRGGVEGFLGMISSKLIYPRNCYLNGTQGRVIVSFLIDTDGIVSDAAIVQSVHPDLDREAIRAVMTSPKWSPGKMHNQLVNVRNVIPIIFQIR
ncbi:MAG: TonB family protein [Bacteroidales bacterium]